MFFNSLNHKNAFFVKVHNYAYAEEISPEEELKNQTNKILDELDLYETEKYFEENQDYYQKIFSVTSFRELLNKILSGELSTNFDSIFKIIVLAIKENLVSFLSPLLVIFMIMLLSSIFKSIRPKISENSISKIILFSSYSIAVTIIAFLFFNCLKSVNGIITQMQNQMNGAFPIVLLLMSAASGNASVAAYKPMVLVLSNVVSNIFTKILIPIVIITFVLGVVGGITEDNDFKGIKEFFSSSFKWVLGISFTVYSAFMTIQGITASSADGIVIKTTKYAIKNYVPMLGGYISDGFEVAKVGSIIIKNAVGFSGIILMLVTILSPILLICAFQLSIKLVEGLSGAVGGKISGIYNATGKSLTLLLVVLISIFMMYFISMMLLICSLGGVWWLKVFINLFKLCVFVRW